MRISVVMRKRTIVVLSTTMTILKTMKILLLLQVSNANKGSE